MCKNYWIFKTHVEKWGEEMCFKNPQKYVKIKNIIYTKISLKMCKSEQKKYATLVKVEQRVVRNSTDCRCPYKLRENRRISRFYPISRLNPRRRPERYPARLQTVRPLRENLRMSFRPPFSSWSRPGRSRSGCCLRIATRTATVLDVVKDPGDE